MIKEIKMYPRVAMEAFARTGGYFARTGGTNFPYLDRLWHLISIYGDGEGDLLTEENRSVFQEMGCRRFLSLNFWDITERAKYPNGILFRKSQAKEIVEMVKEIQKEEEDSVLVAHCSAGVSRSGAVGTFACDYCRLDYNEFMKQNPYLMANPHVLSLLRKEAGMIPDFGSHDGVDKTEETGGIIIPPWVKI